MSVKLRPVGTSNMLTVPAYIKTTSTEYNVFTVRDGAIVYLPKQEAPDKVRELAERHGIYLP